MVEDDVEELFTRAGYRGMLSVLEVDGPGRVEVRAGEQAYAASAFKVAVGLELVCQAADGELDLAEPVRLAPDERTLGGQGLCLFEHPAELALRDLAVLMLTISDNTATDAVIRRVGPQRINDRIAALGLAHTDFACTIREHFAAIGLVPGHLDLDHGAFTRPDTVPYTTAGEMARLVRMIWRDEAGPPAACSELRAMLRSQHLTRKIATGFASDVTVAAKSGTVPRLISNDVGVVTYPDGQRYAVAVFTRALDPDVDPNSDPDEAARLIGTAARMAVEHLRGTTGV